MRFPKTQIVCFANQKGGCGKTTACVSTGAAFAQLGYNVCIVDNDPQCNASQFLGINQSDLWEDKRKTIADIYLRGAFPAKGALVEFENRFQGRLALIPGHPKLSNLEKLLDREMDRLLDEDDASCFDEDEIREEQRLRFRTSLDSLRGQFDLVFIDTPPNLGIHMMTSLIAADWFVLPVFPSAFDLRGLELLTKNVSRIRKKHNPTLRLAGALLGNYDRRTVVDKQVYDVLVQQFGVQQVFKTHIPSNVKFKEATFRGMTIFEHAGDSAGSQAFIELAREMLRRSKPTSATLDPFPDSDALDSVRSAEEVLPQARAIFDALAEAEPSNSEERTDVKEAANV